MPPHVVDDLPLDLFELLPELVAMKDEITAQREHDAARRAQSGR